MPALLEPCSSVADNLEILCAADYPAEEVQWLWPNRIPIGKVTLLVGDPGNGKSLVALDIAARVSRGGAWPDEPQAQGLHSLGPSGSPASVLILSAEDDIRDTIRPRLDAAGADPQRVFVLPTIADLRHDLEKLRTALDRLPDCRLIVIDPMNSYVGPGDSHFHTVVRRVFEPLAKLAAERGIAILAVSHLRKHDGAAIQRAAGSMGFVAAARAVWTVCRDPVQSDRYLMLQVKNNFVAETAGLAYSISSKSPLPLGEGWGEGYSAPSVTWHAESVTTSAVEVLELAKKSRGPEPAELTLAMDYVRGELITGPKSATWIEVGVTGSGLSDRTLRRALVAIGGRARKCGFQGEWEWYLPEHDRSQSIAEANESDTHVPAGVAEPTIAQFDASEPDHSENLAPLEKPDDFERKTGPLWDDSSHSELEPRLPQPLEKSALIRIYPRNPTGHTRKLWPERTQALLTEKSDIGCIVPYEHHLAQCKLHRILKSRYRLGGRKRRLKRLEMGLIKPYTFRDSTRCRAP